MRMSFLCLLTPDCIDDMDNGLPVSATHHPAVDVIENLHTALLSVMKEGEKVASGIDTTALRRL